MSPALTEIDQCTYVPPAVLPVPIAEPGTRNEAVSFTMPDGEILTGHFTLPDPVTGASDNLKPLVVICHGMLNHRFSKVIRNLSRALCPEYPHLCLDFPGMGTSTGITRYGNFNDEYVCLKHVLAQLRKQGYTIVGLIGHSKAGSLVLTYATHHNDIPLIINVSARYDHTQAPSFRFKPEHMQLLQDQGWFEWLKYGKEKERTFIVREEDLRIRSAIDMSIVRDIVLRNDQGAVVTKVLTVHGDQDSIVPVKSAWDFHNQIGKNSNLRQDDDHQIVIIPEGDHSFLTEPEAKLLRQAVREWMDKHWEVGTQVVKNT
ncbi:Alpha/Beta hydrolase protein [Umbelopsis sp. AD052]|nr:Alpha/Beta hydrolase protein [Umbelopsis sp. AD052]